MDNTLVFSDILYTIELQNHNLGAFNCNLIEEVSQNSGALKHHLSTLVLEC